MFRIHRTLAGLLAAGLCVSFAACAQGGGDVVSVNGQKITRADFDRKLEASPGGKQVITQMVQQLLVEQYGKDNKIDVAQADIDKKEAEIKARYPAGQFEQILTQQGLTEKDVQTILKQQIVIERAVSPNIKIADADIKAFYDKNHAMFDTAEQVRARHILVADEKTANDIEAKLKGGAKFEDLAKQFSTDPSTKDKGGELGFFGKGQMVAPFQDAAFALPVGAVSNPVKSPFGWHIIQVEDKHVASKATLASAHDKIVTTLTQQQQQQAIPAFLQQLRAKATIAVTDDRFKDAFPPPLPAVPPAQPAGAGK